MVAMFLTAFSIASILPTYWGGQIKMAITPMKHYKYLLFFTFSIQNCLSFRIYFINFSEILTLKAQKVSYGKPLKNVSKLWKKEAGRRKIAFWVIKSQNFEKNYKIKIKIM